MQLHKRVVMKVLMALDAPGRLQRLLDKNQRSPCFANTPRDLKIEQPFTVSNPEAIFMGDHVRLGADCALRVMRQWKSDATNENDHQEFNPTLKVGNGVFSTGRLQIFVQSEVDIRDDVMFASNVFINDASHGYVTADIPYKHQPLVNIKPVTIEQGCWIGQNVVIQPGVRIGKLSIVGANSVVTRDVPAQCIVAGAPARIIKMWNSDKKSWTQTA